MDVRSTSRSGPPRACGTSEAATRLVANLARLLGDATRPEIAFNALYCVNCLMGEPPQSWGRGRDASREEDHAARRAFIAAASRAQGVPIETRLAEILHPEFAAAVAAAATREEEEEEAPPPDCRLNATLVIANVAGDAEGRRRLLEVAGDRLVAGLAAAIVGPDPERAMLAAYSLGELARPCRAASWRSAARRAPSAPSAARRTAPPSRKTKTKTRWTRRSPRRFLSWRRAVPRAPCRSEARRPWTPWTPWTPTLWSRRGACAPKPSRRPRAARRRRRAPCWRTARRTSGTGSRAATRRGRTKTPTRATRRTATNGTTARRSRYVRYR